MQTFLDYFWSPIVICPLLHKNVLTWIIVYRITYLYSESESHVQLFATPWTYIVHGILQARILEWAAFSFSRGSSQPRDQTQVSHIVGDSLPDEPQGKPKNTGMHSLSFLQGIFLTQESNWGPLHFRRILYQLSYQEDACMLSRLSCVWLCNSMDCSLPGSSVHEILQAIILE